MKCFYCIELNLFCGRHGRRPAKGFTLIELLVVIAIISLLVSILLPSLNKAKEIAKSAVCHSRLHLTGLAQQQYSYDYDGQFATNSAKLPYLFLTTDTQIPMAHGTYAALGYYGMEFSEPYSKSMVNGGPGGMLTCPDSLDVRDKALLNVQGYGPMVFRCQDNSIAGFLTQTGWGGDITGYNKLDISQVQGSPSEMLAFSDLLYTPEYRWHKQINGWNLLFLDGHGATITVDDNDEEMLFTMYGQKPNYNLIYYNRYMLLLQDLACGN